MRRQTSTAVVIACAPGSIELLGSSTFGPVVQAAASIYTRHCHASINVVYGDVGGNGCHLIVRFSANLNFHRPSGGKSLCKFRCESKQRRYCKGGIPGSLVLSPPGFPVTRE